MLNRISLNGKRYVASSQYMELVDYCKENKIPISFIRGPYKRTGRLFNHFYLRLWGRYL
jgi:hypothetical protein